MRIDDNVELLEDGTTECAHCGTQLGKAGGATLSEALNLVRESREAGPSVRVDPAVFTDRPIVLRQRICPGCLVLLATEIAPGDEEGYRSWQVEVPNRQV